MNLREYYDEIRAQEAAIAEEFVLVVSAPTPNGGKAGIVTEVARKMAAKMVVEKLARLATAEESTRFRAEARDRQQQKEDNEHDERVRVTMLADKELQTVKKALRIHRKGK
jgi:hypothetical protein